ncbi:YppG family protein [Virgibacillus halophilus]|uniref:YppG family protein n=2 Tax=Tigheibacillus halophilus TaxID=361280 RepID=A0ABU5C8K4_9BACI|nr:YppG family protein [Virgibacillus halophilus]
MAGSSPAMHSSNFYNTPSDAYTQHDYTGQQNKDVPYLHPELPDDPQHHEQLRYPGYFQEPQRAAYPEFPPYVSEQPYPGQQQSYQPYPQQTNDPAPEGTAYSTAYPSDMTPFQQFDFPQQSPPWPTQMNPQQPMKHGGVMGYFHDDNGQLDVDKMLSTVGHMANTFQQLTPVVKGLGSLFSAFRK